jgi:tetratricopeptide (TPR) repeat protein
MKIASYNGLFVACVSSLLFLSGCAHRDDGLAPVREQQAKLEAILAKDPSNYHAIHDLAIIYSSFYWHDTVTVATSAQSQKEKALAMIHQALQQVPLYDKADLGEALEHLGNDREALSVYEQFLQDAPHAPVPGSQSVSNVPPMIQREQEANWRGLITIVQTRADLLKKMLGTS